MSILIKGMEMPVSCDDCRLKRSRVYAVRTEECHYFCRNVDPYVGMGERPDWCPLVEVPTPHGRLIDADALMNTPIEVEHGIDGSARCVPLGVLPVLNLAPTIIEAEEET